ncbi:beta-galactosidase [Tunturiibacter empetritectus]|uniref:beta-galactosidase n=1 Tax=Tunturiibacter lichenicola TaxID=2051959 RepID=A0A7W8J3Q1_9BACT|nr:hypothetical protein [Edaphobacter lichenicola]
MGGESQSLTGDYIRSFKHGNYLVTETNAQTTDWTSAWQYPPYDGQLRQDVYTHLSNGADMVEHWHWHSIHSGQETYWKGVLGHDLEPNRAYAEVSRTAHELDRIGQHLVGLKITNQVAILYSVDSANVLDFMPFSHSAGPQWTSSPPAADYGALVTQMHRVLYNLNIGTDFVFPEDADFSKYKVLIVPALYIAHARPASRILRSPVLRALARHHPQPVRVRHIDLRGHLAQREASDCCSLAGTRPGKPAELRPDPAVKRTRHSRNRQNFLQEAGQWLRSSLLDNGQAPRGRCLEMFRAQPVCRR